MLLCPRRLWTPHQSCCSGQCLAQLCTQPYLSPTLCESLATASCQCLPTGPHQIVNIRSTQVKKKKINKLLFHFSLRQLPVDVLFWAFPRVSSAAVCAQSHRRTLLQLQRKHWERFDHGVCRGASTFEGVNKLHSACKWNEQLIEWIQMSSFTVQRGQYLSVLCNLCAIAHGQEPGITEFDTLFLL